MSVLRTIGKNAAPAEDRLYNSTFKRPAPKTVEERKEEKKAKPIKNKGVRGKRLTPALEAAYAIAKERSGGICQAFLCGNPATEVHHLRTRSAAAHLRENAANLADLCEECHRLWQPDGARFRQMYAEIHPYFDAIYNTRGLDEGKVGKWDGTRFVPLTEVRG